MKIERNWAVTLGSVPTAICWQFVFQNGWSSLSMTHKCSLVKLTTEHSKRVKWVWKERSRWYEREKLLKRTDLFPRISHHLSSDRPLAFSASAPRDRELDQNFGFSCCQSLNRSRSGVRNIENVRKKFIYIYLEYIILILVNVAFVMFQSASSV